MKAITFVTQKGGSGKSTLCISLAVAAQEAGRVRDADYTTLSGMSVDPVYGPAPGDVVQDFERIGWPGEFPFTRGLHATGYRGKPWTIRQFAGFGNAMDTNRRYQMILAEGGNGLSVAFDLPTQTVESARLGQVGEQHLRSRETVAQEGRRCLPTSQQNQLIAPVGQGPGKGSTDA